MTPVRFVGMAVSLCGLVALIFRASSAMACQSSSWVVPRDADKHGGIPLGSLIVEARETAQFENRAPLAGSGNGNFPKIIEVEIIRIVRSTGRVNAPAQARVWIVVPASCTKHDFRLDRDTKLILQPLISRPASERMRYPLGWGLPYTFSDWPPVYTTEWINILALVQANSVDELKEKQRKSWQSLNKINAQFWDSRLPHLHGDRSQHRAPPRQGPVDFR